MKVNESKIFEYDDGLTASLTKRELLAAMAMQGFCTQYSEYTNGNVAKECAKYAVKLADALILELAKDKK